VGQSGRETRGAQGARGTRTSNPPQVNNLVNNLSYKTWAPAGRQAFAASRLRR